MTTPVIPDPRVRERFQRLAAQWKEQARYLSNTALPATGGVANAAAPLRAPTFFARSRYYRIAGVVHSCGWAVGSVGNIPADRRGACSGKIALIW